MMFFAEYNALRCGKEEERRGGRKKRRKKEEHSALSCQHSAIFLKSLATLRDFRRSITPTAYPVLPAVRLRRYQ
jgi:hypothetical protein